MQITSRFLFQKSPYREPLMIETVCEVWAEVPEEGSARHYAELYSFRVQRFDGTYVTPNDLSYTPEAWHEWVEAAETDGLQKAIETFREQRCPDWEKV
jgi:hypothetical protein